MMQREEFIRRYMLRSGVDDYAVEGPLVRFDDALRYALPCACGDETCEGWQMVSDPTDYLQSLLDAGAGLPTGEWLTSRALRVPARCCVGGPQWGHAFTCPKAEG